MSGWDGFRFEVLGILGQLYWIGVVQGSDSQAYLPCRRDILVRKTGQYHPKNLLCLTLPSKRMRREAPSKLSLPCHAGRRRGGRYDIVISNFSSADN